MIQAIPEPSAEIAKLVAKNKLRKTTLSNLSSYVDKTRACVKSPLVSSLPQGRAAQVSDVREYYFFGHDVPESAIQKISPVDCGDIGIFFGGCGDCRHVFATLFDLQNRFDESQLKRTHIELCDVHDFCFARLIVIAYLSDEMYRFRDDPRRQTKIAATLMHFSFDCLLNSESWDTILLPAIKKLHGEFNSLAQGKPSRVTEMFPWLECEVGAAKAIAAAIEQWQTQAGVVSAASARDQLTKVIFPHAFHECNLGPHLQTQL